MKKINKIVVKHSVIFYSEAQMHRNEMLHDSGKCREFVLEWHNKLVEKIEKGSKPTMRTYIRKQKLNLEKCDTSYIRLQNTSMTKMMRNAIEERVNDIWNYFPVR